MRRKFVKMFTFGFVLILLMCGLASASGIAITTDPANQLYPAIYGDKIVWEDHRNNADIYCYNLAQETETQITADLSYQGRPAIYGNNIAWEDHRNWLSDIYVSSFRRTNGHHSEWSEVPGMPWCISWESLDYYSPDIYGDRIACEYDRACGFYCSEDEHVTYDVCSGEPAGRGILVSPVGLIELNISDPSASLFDPAIYGSNVVYAYTTFVGCDIYMKNIYTDNLRRISYSEHAARPDIYEHDVVWQDNRNGSWDIYMKNISTHTEYSVCTAFGDQEMPAIHDNKIVWQDHRNGNWDIYMYDLATDTDDDGIPNYMDPDRPSPDPAEVPLCTDTDDQKNPAVYDDKIVWQDNRNGNWDIYLHIIGADTGWSYRKAITIDYTKVNATLPDFPVLISITDSDLRDCAQDDGDDILFVNADNSIKLDHEIEYFNGSTGELQAWVRIPSLSSSTNTTIYMYYGNPTCGSQQNAAGVWDSNFKMVQHLEETSKTAGTYNDHLDSTSNNNNGEAEMEETHMDTTGQINGADDFDGGNDYVDCGNDDSLNITDTITIEAWVYLNSISSNNPIVARCFPTPQDGIYFYQYQNWNELLFEIRSGGHEVYTGKFTEFTPNEWHHCVATYDGAYVKVYVDGILGSTVGETTGPLIWTSSKHLDVGRDNLGNFFDGTIDEVRISSTARSEDWIKTCYNNQNDPSTFYTVGYQEGNPVQPVPELPTVILFSIGLFLLAGYVVLRRKDG